jgi:hypothetical protein
MSPSPVWRSATVLCLLVGCALGGTLACKRPPDAGYWKDRRDLPRPFPAIEIDLAWDREVAFCPETIRPAGDGQFVIRAGDRWSRFSADDGSDTPPTGAPADPPQTDPATGQAAARLEEILDREHPEMAPRSSFVFWDDQAFFVLTESGTLQSMHREKGRLRWKVRAGASVVVPPQVLHGRVVFQSLDNYVYCLRAKNGHEMWRARSAARLTRPAAFWRDRILVIPESSATVEAFDMYDGSRAGGWTLPGDDEHFLAAPLVLGDMLIAAHAPYGSRRCSIAALRLAAPPP